MVMEILKDPMTLVTHGSTYENKANLASQFFGRIIKRYEGTRLGRQELDGIVLDDNPHAIFFQNLIDRDRISKDMVPGDLARIAVAIDPAVTATSDSDETGMVIGARDCRPEPHYYIFEDITQTAASPATWARAAVDGYRRRRADVIIGEVNNGGDLVESNIRNADSNVNFVSVRASHGKVIRAEPVGALYEQGRVHHVGKFDVLEKQMCGFDPTIQGQKSPDRMDALVWLLTELSEADTSPEPVTAGARRRML
jgi:phage terminase large subunit-like protein